MKADAAQQPIHGQTRAADQFRERAPDDAQQNLKLKSAILPLTEAQAKPRIGIVASLNVRDAPAVAVDAHSSRTPGTSIVPRVWGRRWPSVHRKSWRCRFTRDIHEKGRNEAAKW